MEFKISNGPFVKDSNNVQKIILTNLLTLLPFVVYRCFINGVNSIILFIISIISSILTSVLFDYVKDKKIDYKNYYKDLIFSIIVVFITPLNIPHLLIFFANIIVVLVSKFYNEINIYAIVSSILSLFMLLTNNNLVFGNYNIYIFLVLLFITLITLISNRSIKFRITISFIIFVIIKMILNNSITNIDYVLLFMSLYVIPEFKSTPNTALIQIIFGIVVGVISILINIELIFIIIIILNILFKYIDKYYSYYLAK